MLASTINWTFLPLYTINSKNYALALNTLITKYLYRLTLNLKQPWIQSQTNWTWLKIKINHYRKPYWIYKPVACVDNLIFTGIQENAQDKPEELIKDFIKNQLKLTLDTVDKITFHRIGPKSNARPRPIVAKFEQFKQKELVKSRGRQLKGTTFGLNDQYPKEIQEHRKILYPILKDSDI